MIDNIGENNGHPVFTFWASNAYCMNDPAEMQLGYDFFRGYIERADSKLTEKERLLSLMPESGDNMFTPNSEDYYLGMTNNPFVISFTSKCDYLPMWTLYGSNGCGICLCFDEEKIKNYIRNKPDIYLQSVAYHQKESENATPELKLLADVICKSLQEYCLQMDSFCGIDNVNTLKKSFLKRLCPFVSAFIKVGDYSHEQEIRLLSICNLNNPQVNYRISTKHNVIPYVDVKIPAYSLCSIILGPKVSSLSNKLFVELALNRKGVKTDILCSEAQFRSY